MEGPLRYRQLRNYANRRNIRIRHLRDRFNPLEEYHNEDFRLRFRLRKDSVFDLVKILEKDFQHQTRRGLPLEHQCSKCLLLWDSMSQELFKELLAIYLELVHLLHVLQFTRFQRLLRNKEHNSCHSQKTWLIQRESFMMLRTFQVWSGPSIVPTSGSYVQTKKMLWHLLTESSFTPSTSKPFVRAMPLLQTS